MELEDVEDAAEDHLPAASGGDVVRRCRIELAVDERLNGFAVIRRVSRQITEAFAYVRAGDGPLNQFVFEAFRRCGQQLVGKQKDIDEIAVFEYPAVEQGNDLGLNQIGI